MVLVKDLVLSQPINIPKPILKWVGGKTQILDKIIANFPTEIDNYHEIFLGGSSVLLALLCYVKAGLIKINGSIYASDLNEPLMYMYQNIKTKHLQLYQVLQEMISEFNQCGEGELNRQPENITEAQLCRENYYYWIRKKYNHLSNDDKKTVIGSACFIFLNKTGFRGLFRTGPNGFNVPYGNYRNPEIINFEHLELIHNLVQNVVFTCCNFTSSLGRVMANATATTVNDFIYLDPPYVPEKATSFVGYTENGFNLTNHLNLFHQLQELAVNKVKFMLSNSDVSLVREHFPTSNYRIATISCKRAINSKKPDSKTNELIICSY